VRKYQTETQYQDDDTSDPGVIPGGVRDRAMAAVMMRGPTPEDKKKTAASIAYWKSVREKAGGSNSERESCKLSHLVHQM
jgi:hypothetical protein